jgi:spermidine/putrescine transport system substrate-binding protein
VIPINAEHPGTALLFIEYMLEPENAAQNVEWIGYPMPYDGAATEAFDGLVKEDPEISITVEDLEQGKRFENLSGDGRLEWDEVWTEFRVS